MTEIPDASAAELARSLADALESAQIPYALGGALAYGVWGVPRATQDVDLNVFVGALELARTFDCLRAAGCSVNDVEAQAAASERGEFQVWRKGMRVDVFVPSIPFYDSVKNRIRQVVFRGKPTWFLAPEDLAVFKMLFYRPKDLLDLERLLAIQGSKLDVAYVRTWLITIVGPQSERIGKWDELVSAAARTATFQ
jgi:hypothetical protein